MAPRRLPNHKGPGHSDVTEGRSPAAASRGLTLLPFAAASLVAAAPSTTILFACFTAAVTLPNIASATSTQPATTTITACTTLRQECARHVHGTFYGVPATPIKTMHRKDIVTGKKGAHTATGTRCTTGTEAGLSEGEGSRKADPGEPRPSATLLEAPGPGSERRELAPIRGQF